MRVAVAGIAASVRASIARLSRRALRPYDGIRVSVQRIRLGFLVAGLLVGVASIAQSAFEIEQGRWSLSLTVALYVLGVAIGGLNLIYPSSPEIAFRVSTAVWPIGTALVVLFAIREVIAVDIDKLVTPVVGGLCLLLAAILAVDRAKHNRRARWDDERGA